jgi:hypothetical protein
LAAGRFGDQAVQRHHAFAALVLLFVGGASAVSREAVAQDWAAKMFSETKHDFGTVARGAKVEYRFQFYNPYKEAVRVAGVSSSCGCTTPEVVKRDLATYEKSEIIARFNTGAFTGNHSATLTVTIDRPYYATVQLNVWGDIRGDIEVKSADSNVDSGVVDFGTVEQGESRERRMTVVRYGRSDWQIVDVRSVNSNYEVEVVDGPRSAGRVSYDLIVRLKKEASPGYLHEPLILVTNDSQVPQFPIEVEGIVKAELNVSPQVLILGTIEAGQQVIKPLFVSGHKPFKIVAVRCDDESFTFKIPGGAKTTQIIPVTFTAANKPGKVVKKIQIETDLGKTLTLEVLAQAQITASPKGTTDTSDPKTESTNPVKATTPSDSAAGNVLKLDSSANDSPSNSATANNGTTATNSTAATSSTTGSGASSGAQPVAPTVVKPTSVIANPIRSKSAQPSTGSSAAAN